MRRFVFLSLFLPAALLAEPLTVSFQPKTPVNGVPILFTVTSAEELSSLEGAFLGRTVHFNVDRATGTWFGLGGISLETPKGNHPLSVRAQPLTGPLLATDWPIPVGHLRYPRERLRVPPEALKLNDEEILRSEQDSALKKNVFGRSSADRLWSGPFAHPLQSLVTSPFGAERFFNDVIERVHTGVDFRAEVGTPVRAMNAGTVVLARDLLFEGGFVIVDHGQGLFSLYLHLSKLNVKEGDFVKKETVIGRSGASGKRIKGAHLDVRIRWQGIYLNPETLFALPLPTFSDGS